MPEARSQPSPRSLDPDARRQALLQELAQLDGVTTRTDEPLARHLPLRCGGPADIWALVDDDTALRHSLRAARQAGLPWRLCWPCEDILVRDGGLAGLVVRPGAGFEGYELLPEDPDGPARLRLGSATPWAAAGAAIASAHALADPKALARGPLSMVARWSGCPGGLLQSGDAASLQGLCHALTWRKGKRVERLVFSDKNKNKNTALSSAPSAVPLSVELPLVMPAGVRRSSLGPPPPPPGTAFANDGAIRSGPMLAASGLLGSRLRDWLLSKAQPGVLVNRGNGDCATALLFLKGAADLANRRRGAQLQLRVPVVGSDERRRR